MDSVYLPDVCGTLGGLLIVGAYFLVQVERMDARTVAYSIVNALGAGLILASLLFDFNLGAMLVESFWLLVSVYGVVKWSRDARPPARPDSQDSE